MPRVPDSLRSAATAASRGGAPAGGPGGPLFAKSRARFSIASIDVPAIRVEAQYNPKELQVDKQLTWGDHQSTAPTDEDPASPQNSLEFTGNPPRSMSFELLFDCFEPTGPQEKRLSVTKQIDLLETLALVQIKVNSNNSDQKEKRRPHHCIAIWGHGSGGPMRPFLCVIESIGTKYTMWDRDGVPVRATCNLKLKEAHYMGEVGATKKAIDKLVRR